MTDNNVEVEVDNEDDIVEYNLLPDIQDTVNNTYKNKNVLFTDGNKTRYSYVTNSNVVRFYQDKVQYDLLKGKNKCPTEEMIIQVSDIDSLDDDIFNKLDLPFNIGNNMTNTTSCGYELTNIFLKPTISQSNLEPTTYVGCYNINNIINKSPDQTNENYNFNSCKYLAYQTGNTYFGLINTGVGKNKCFLTNEIPTTSTSLTSTVFNPTYPNNSELIKNEITIPFIPITSLSQSSINYIKVNDSPNRINTSLCGYDLSDNKIGYFGTSIPGKINVTKLTLDVYGNLNIIDNNLNKYSIYRRPDSIIPKAQELWTINNIIASGGKLRINKSMVSYNKKYNLTLNDKGELKYVYYTSAIRCDLINKVNFGKTINDTLKTVSLYKFNNNIVNPATYVKENNKINTQYAYVDKNGNKKIYPQSMLKLDLTYNQLPNYDMLGNDKIQSGITNESKCKTTCNNDNSCYGYTFNNGICNLKSNYSYIVPSTNTIKIRNQTIISNEYCNSTVNNLGSSEWNTFKTDSSMNPNYKCVDILNEGFQNLNYSDITEAMEVTPDPSDFVYPPIIGTTEEKNTYKTSINRQNRSIIDAANSNNLDLNVINNFSNYDAQTNQDNTNYAIYGRNKTNFVNFINGNGNTNITESMINMNTLDELLGDTDLMIVQEKYKNIFWSILAIGTFIFTISNLKK